MRYPEALKGKKVYVILQGDCIQRLSMSDLFFFHILHTRIDKQSSKGRYSQ